MAQYSNQHSKIVAIAKLVLPMISLLLLATLFFFSREQEYDLSELYSSVDIETIAREQRIEAPAYAGVTQKGEEVAIIAGLVRPNLRDSNVVNVDVVSASLGLLEQGAIEVRANDFVLDGPSRIAEFSGDVVIESSNGYSISSKKISSMLDIVHMESLEGVTAFGPAGQIKAATFELKEKPEGQSYRLFFSGGVHLEYKPE